MQKCKKCGCDFPFWVCIDGKRKNIASRSYCLSCSPFRSNKGKELQKEFNLSAIGTGEERKKICPKCNRIFKWTKNNVCPSCRSTKKRKERREKAICLLGGKCSKCGIADYDVLTFHHVNPKEKSLAFSYSWTKNWANIEKELKKCVLLCANCHIKEHRKLNE